MKRLIIMTIIKMLGEAILLTVVVGIIIGVIGYKNKWDTSMAYSNAFFIAGALAIIAGGTSRLGASQGMYSFQMLYSETFRDMSSAEKRNYIIEASSSLRMLILGVLSGIMLMVLSVLVTKLF